MRPLVATAESFVLGDPAEPGTTMGPLVSKQQHDRVLGYIEAGKADGAVVATGGGVPPGLETGYFIQPTVFTQATNSMRISQEEIFGSRVSVLGYDTIDEAIALRTIPITGCMARCSPVTRSGPQTWRAEFAPARSASTPSSTTPKRRSRHQVLRCRRDTGPEALQAFYELKTVNLTEGMQPLFA